MKFNFDFLLIFITIATGLVYFLDLIWWRKERKKQVIEKPTPIIEFSNAFFGVFILVFFIRSFFYSPFYVPTGSLEPTIIPIEFIAINHYSYGLRFPLWNKKILNIGEPKHGDIVLFKWPVDPRKDFIKRVIGLPGDKISYINRVLYVNGVEAKQTFINYVNAVEGNHEVWHMKHLREDFFGVKHDIYQCADNHCLNSRNNDFYNLVVPPKHYFMMGDNRDNSDDSRDWGFVSESELVGKGSVIFMSFDSNKHRIRWSRIGKTL